MIKTQKPKVGEPDLSAVHVWLVLWKAAHAVGVESDRSIARFDIGRSDFGVLEALLHRGTLNARQLGEKVLLTSGSVTAAIDRLEARGLVRRSGSIDDRRACMVALTPAGHALIEKAFARHRAALEASLRAFGAKDRRILLPLLRKLGRTAEAATHEAKSDSGLASRRRQK